VSDDAFPDRAMPFREKIDWMIESQGWAVVPVPPRLDLDPPFPGYTYTVGLEPSFGFPEVIVFGLKPADARGLLGMVVALLRDGVEIPVGPLFAGLLDNDLRSALLPVDLGDWGPLFAAGQDWYGATPFRVVQLAYPDPNGWLPWEPGFDMARRLSQPVIGTVEEDTGEP
jgi:hypothetical protein